MPHLGRQLAIDGVRVSDSEFPVGHKLNLLSILLHLQRKQYYRGVPESWKRTHLRKKL